jgi:hypothetical protein
MPKVARHRQKLSARNHHGHLGATAALRRQYPHSLSEQIFDVAISVREPHMEPNSVPDDHGRETDCGQSRSICRILTMTRPSGELGVTKPAPEPYVRAPLHWRKRSSATAHTMTKPFAMYCQMSGTSEDEPVAYHRDDERPHQSAPDRPYAAYETRAAQDHGRDRVKFIGLPKLDAVRRIEPAK